MRIEQFLQTTGTATRQVDRFDNFMVKVGLPPMWQPMESPFATPLWIWVSDPCIKEFGANAVLTMYVLDSPITGREIFPMLCEQQLQTFPQSRESKRELQDATEGPGLTGILVTQMDADVGAIDTVAWSRMITTDRETMIAQLTVTALHNSPVDWPEIWLSVETATTTGSVSVSRSGGAPVEQMPGGRH